MARAGAEASDSEMRHECREQSLAQTEHLSPSSREGCQKGEICRISASWR